MLSQEMKERINDLHREGMDELFERHNNGHDVSGVDVSSYVVEKILEEKHLKMCNLTKGGFYCDGVNDCIDILLN